MQKGLKKTMISSCMALATAGMVIAFAPMTAKAAAGDPVTAYFTDFESGVDGWTFVDADGDGWGWGYDMNVQGVVHPSTPDANLVAYSGQYVIGSASYINGVGELSPDNWAITPAIVIPEQGLFSMWVCAQDADYPSEKFGVYIGTSTDISTMTELQTWILTKAYTPSVGFSATPKAPGNWYNYTVDVSAYAGQTCYIAIRHFDSYDMFWMNVDDVSVTGVESASTPAAPVDNTWIQRLVNSINNAAAIAAATGNSETVTLSGDFALPIEVMQALANASNVTFEYTVTYGGQTYVIALKGGQVKVDPNIQWYGPAYLLANYYGKTDAAAGGSGTYVVQRGDYLFKIAAKLGTTVQALVQANGIQNPDLIFPGQVLNY